MDELCSRDDVADDIAGAESLLQRHQVLSFFVCKYFLVVASELCDCVVILSFSLTSNQSVCIFLLFLLSALFDYVDD